MANRSSSAVGRRGDWIQLISGEPFWPLDARPEDVRINDIAWALSMQCRFGGHCRKFYSVAEHSVMVSRMVSPKDAFWGLLHDAPEAYLVDLPRPIKQNMPDYRTYENALAEIICERFGLDYTMPAEVGLADGAILLAERAQLMAPSKLSWEFPQSKVNETGMPLPVLACWDPSTAYSQFLQEFSRLERDG